MRSRAVRLTLTLLAVGGIGFAAYLLIINQRQSNASAYLARDFDAQIAAAGRQTLELRAAQQAYVATAQDPKFWSAKTTEIFSLLRASLSTLRDGATTAASRVAVEEAEQTLKQFERMDGRAREYTSNGHVLLASDLIFSDGLENTSRVLNALDQLRVAEWNERTLRHAVARREQLTYAAAAAGGALLIILLLLPVPAQKKEEHSSIAPAPAVADPVRDLDLRTTPPDRPAASRRTQPAPRPQVSAPAAPAPNLENVASVCSELARISDTASLPAILQRTAEALDASGIVLWVIDPEGKELSPIVSHGYPPALLARMGTIARDADNVTAAAFRTGLLQVVSGDQRSSGALAAPLVNPGGCIGVMSAELRHEGEKQPVRRAAATIVAAQLATLVGPPVAQDNRSAAI